MHKTDSKQVLWRKVEKNSEERVQRTWNHMRGTYCNAVLIVENYSERGMCPLLSNCIFTGMGLWAAPSLSSLRLGSTALCLVKYIGWIRYFTFKCWLIADLSLFLTEWKSRRLAGRSWLNACISPVLKHGPRSLLYVRAESGTKLYA